MVLLESPVFPDLAMTDGEGGAVVCGGFEVKYSIFPYNVWRPII